MFLQFAETMYSFMALKTFYEKQIFTINGRSFTGYYSI